MSKMVYRIADLVERWPIGTLAAIEHDGFEGTVIGYYERPDRKMGVVLQQVGTCVVHVYGEKWLKPVATGGDAHG